jgi:tRNA-specific 2-thiouridylase
VAIWAKIRYRAAAARATLTYLGGNEAAVRFFEAQPAITPGQGAVFYDGDVVLGGGIIEEVG